MANSAPYPDIHAMSAESAQATVPAEYQVGTKPLKGHSGFFTGRKAELAQLKYYFSAEGKAERLRNADPSKRFAALVTNAPGAGKTALVNEFAIQMEDLGIACPRVTPEILASPAELIDRIRMYIDNTARGKRQAKRRDALAVATSSAVPAAGGAASEVALAPGSGKLVSAGLKALQAIARGVSGRWLAQAPTTVEQAWKQLSEANPAGFIMIVDEASGLIHPDYDQRAIGAHLRMVADSTDKTATALNGGLLLAGLGSADEVADELKLSRALTLWLPAPSIDDSEAIIRAEIANADINPDRQQRLADAWAPQLAGEFSGWMEHAAAAADIAARMAERTETPPGAPDPESAAEAQHLEWVRLRTAFSISRLYDERIRASEAAVGPDGIGAIVALADLTDNAMPMRAVQRVIGHCRECTPALVSDESGIAAGVRALKEAGVIAPYADDRPQRVSWGTARIPLPNLRAYVRTDLRPQVMADADHVATQLLPDPSIQ